MAGKDGVRLEIPAHLRQTFRLLDSHGAELKKRHPTTKRSIKFEDATGSLVLDVKIDDQEGWIRINPNMAEEARSLREERPHRQLEGPLRVERPDAEH